MRESAIHRARKYSLDPTVLTRLATSDVCVSVQVDSYRMRTEWELDLIYSLYVSNSWINIIRNVFV